MSERLKEQAIAFAGVCQAAHQVQQVARHGNFDAKALETSVGSLLVTNPKSTADVFANENEQGELAGLTLGLQCLIDQLGNEPKKDPEITRYVVSLLALERKLSRRRDMLSLMGNRIDQVKRQRSHFSLTDNTILSNLADIYSEFISPLGPRIQVSGTPLHLQQSGNQYRVRSLLLAGIRAAILWRQVGGKRRHLLLNRVKLVQSAEDLRRRL